MLIEANVAGLNLLTIIECRDYAKRLDITHVDALHSKMQDVNANKAVLISRKGFSKKAINKANRLGITLCTLNNPDIELADIGLEIPIHCTHVAKIRVMPSFTVRARMNSQADLASALHPCLLYTSPSPRDRQKSRMPSSA